MKEPPKQKKKYYVKLKSGFTYSVNADYMKYEEELDGVGILYFYKKIPRKKNPDTKDGSWIVAYAKDTDVEIVCLESFVTNESIPMTKDEVLRIVVKTGISVCTSFIMFVLFNRFKKY